MKHIFLIAVAAILFSPSTGFAERKEVIAEGTYIMGDGETPIVAESRALVQAKKIAIEHSGTYVESYSKVRNIMLTEDEIQTLASGLMEIEILDKKRSIVGEGISFWIRIKARINTDKMDEMAKRVKERTVAEEYKRIQEAFEQSRKEIVELKKQLIAEKGSKDKIKVKIITAEKWFQANEWLEKSKIRWLNNQHDDAIVDASVAILLNPNAADAYMTRGVAYAKKGQHNSAIDDYNRAIEREPNSIFSYYNRGLSYQIVGQYEKAVEDYNKTIALKPDDADTYINRGLTHLAMGNGEDAFADFQKACDLGCEAGCRDMLKASKHKNK